MGPPPSYRLSWECIVFFFPLSFSSFFFFFRVGVGKPLPPSSLCLPGRVFFFFFPFAPALAVELVLGLSIPFFARPMAAGNLPFPPFLDRREKDLFFFFPKGQLSSFSFVQTPLPFLLAAWEEALFPLNVRTPLPHFPNIVFFSPRELDLFPLPIPPQFPCRRPGDLLSGTLWTTPPFSFSFSRVTLSTGSKASFPLRVVPWKTFSRGRRGLFLLQPFIFSRWGLFFSQNLRPEYFFFLKHANAVCFFLLVFPFFVFFASGQFLLTTLMVIFSSGAGGRFLLPFFPSQFLLWWTNLRPPPPAVWSDNKRFFFFFSPARAERGSPFPPKTFPPLGMSKSVFLFFSKETFPPSFFQRLDVTLQAFFFFFFSLFTTKMNVPFFPVKLPLLSRRFSSCLPPPPHTPPFLSRQGCSFFRPKGPLFFSFFSSRRSAPFYIPLFCGSKLVCPFTYFTRKSSLFLPRRHPFFVVPPFSSSGRPFHSLKPIPLPQRCASHFLMKPPQSESFFLRVMFFFSSGGCFLFLGAGSPNQGLEAAFSHPRRNLSCFFNLYALFSPKKG